jgi:hypothetical protein
MFIYMDNKNNRVEVTANEQFVSGNRTRWYINEEMFSDNKRGGHWLTDERGLVKFFDTEKQAITEIKNYLNDLISKGVIKEYAEE